MPLRTVLYTRYSSEDTAKRGGSSTASQLQQLREEARRKGEIIVAELHDQARTGTEMMKRDAYQEVLRMRKNREFDILRFESIDRQGRNETDRHLVQYELKRYGVVVLYLGEDYNAPEIVQRLERGMKGLFAEYYAVDISNKKYTRDRYRAEQGKFRGGSYPYGLAPDGEGWFVPDEATYPFLLFILTKRALGWGYPRIAGALNRGVSIDGPAAKRPETPRHVEWRKNPIKYEIDPETGEQLEILRDEPTLYWNSTTVGRICKRAIDGVYAGVLHWGNPDNPMVKRKKDAQGNPKQPVRYDKHAPLVDRNLLAAVAEIEAGSKGKKRGGPPPSYIIKPKCGTCGSPMTFNYRKYDRTYKNGNTATYIYRDFACTAWYESGGTRCTQRPVDADHIDKEVLAALQRELESLDPEVLQAEWASVQTKLEGQFLDKIAELKRRLEDLEELKEGDINALRKISPDSVLFEEIQKRAETTILEIRSLEAVRSRIQRGLQGLRDKVGKLDYTILAPLYEKDIWTDPDQRDALRRMVSAVVEEVRAFEGKGNEGALGE